LSATPEIRPPDRLENLRQWLQTTPAAGVDELTPASVDASFRRYFRVACAGRSYIVMDAPPDKEDSAPFIRVAGLLADAGLHVPEIIAADIAQGFLLLTDLGPNTYLHVLDSTNCDALFRDAITALVRMQAHVESGSLPAYDESMLRRELALFPDWYISRHLGQALTDERRNSLAAVETALVQSALAQPVVFTHRDYMPRNLMVSTPNPGILDFQDAVAGPISYDPVCLFKDAFISWPEEQVLDWTVRYWEAGRRAGLPLDSDFGRFYQDFEWMGVHRHLKVLGIFARIRYRDGKPAYLEDAPRFLKYLRQVCVRYRELMPLANLLDFLESKGPQVGYTF
jgi:aminoglycoside/choline kinase family phosphotransferase